MPDNRRRDEKLRDAIDVIQALMFNPSAAGKIINIVFEQSFEIAGADIGGCYILRDNFMSILSNLESNYISIGENEDAVSELVIRRWVEEDTLPKTKALYNGKIPQRYSAVFDSTAHVSASIFLPITLHNKSIAFVLLAKQEGLFHPNIINRLSSLLSAGICSLQNAESVKGSFTGLGKKIASEAYLSSIVSSSPCGILVVNTDKMITVSNPSAVGMLRGDMLDFHQSLVGLPIENFIPDYDDFFQWSTQKLKYDLPTPPELPVIWEDQLAYLLDGNKARLKISLFRYQVGQTTFTTLQMVKKEEFRQTKRTDGIKNQELLPTIMHLMPIAIVQVDEEWNCVFSNEKWTDISGLGVDESLAQDWMNAVHSEDRSLLMKGMKKGVQSTGEYRHDCRLITPLGVVKYIDVYVRSILNDNLQTEGFLLTFTDITDTQKTTAQLTNVAHYDGLTGLANRLLFQDRVEQAFIVSEREGSQVCLFFLDLDGFKQVNDEHGHDAGDIILKLVAQRLLDVLRRNDTIGRFGGDEFVILLGHDDHETEIVTVAEKIINILAMPYTVNQKEATLTASVGIAQGSHKNSNPKKLLKQADSALYLAKNDGKNNYKIFDEKVDAEARKRSFLVNQLRRGLKQGSFSLHYQPICTIGTGKIIGFEALLRFTDVNNILIMPNDFIPILEETGVILEVGEWVIHQVCRQIVNWQIRDLFPDNGYVSFNVSGKQLMDASLYNVIKSALEENQLKPEHLLLEMTETILIDSGERTLTLMNDIRNLGIRMALDDFGTGYSSLSYLQAFPCDYLKIDKSFIFNLEQQADNQKITRAIVALAKSLNIRVIAEGVEEHDSLDLLAEMDADFFQGFYLSKPIPESQVKTFLTHHLPEAYKGKGSK